MVFDVVDHSNLLTKLKCYGFKGQVNTKSYLLDRKIITTINSTLPSERYIIYGVTK